MKRSSTAEQRRHMALAAALGCAVCKHCLDVRGTPAEVHHVKVRGGWGRSDHFFTLPLCPEHHRGRYSVHGMGRDQFTAHFGITELSLLKTILATLERPDLIAEVELQLADFPIRRSFFKHSA